MARRPNQSAKLEFYCICKFFVSMDIFFLGQDRRSGNTFPSWTQYFSTYVVSTNVAGLGTTYDVPLRDDCNIFWYRSPGSSTSFKNLGLPSFPGFIPERHKHRPFQPLTLSPPFLRFSLPSPQIANTITFSLLDSRTFYTYIKNPCSSSSGHGVLAAHPQTVLRFAHPIVFSRARFFLPWRWRQDMRPKIRQISITPLGSI